MYFDQSFHYPPEVTQLLIDTIPLLCRSKRDVVLFFRGAGVESAQISDIELKIQTDRDSINKYEMTRTILERINHQGTAYLAQRREVIKRIVEFEDFSRCWPNDQLKSKGLVSDLQKIVNVKDTFTRIKQSQEADRKRQLDAMQDEVEKKQARIKKIQEHHKELLGLFSDNNPHARGKKLEAVLNAIFSSYGILLKESFEIKGQNAEGIIEQIDGVVEHNSAIYLVEMKWWKDPLGPGEVAQHLVRVFGRSQCRGIFISYSGFTEAAVNSCKESLQRAVFVLMTLQEIVVTLERHLDLSKIIKSKVEAAVLHKNPFHNPIDAGEQLDF